MEQDIENWWIQLKAIWEVYCITLSTLEYGWMLMYIWNIYQKNQQKTIKTNIPVRKGR